MKTTAEPDASPRDRSEERGGYRQLRAGLESRLAKPPDSADQATSHRVGRGQQPSNDGQDHEHQNSVADALALPVRGRVDAHAAVAGDVGALANEIERELMPARGAVDE